MASRTLSCSILSTKSSIFSHRISSLRSTKSSNCSKVSASSVPLPGIIFFPPLSVKDRWKRVLYSFALSTLRCVFFFESDRFQLIRVNVLFHGFELRFHSLDIGVDRIDFGRERGCLRSERLLRSLKAFNLLRRIASQSIRWHFIRSHHVVVQSIGIPRSIASRPLIPPLQGLQLLRRPGNPPAVMKRRTPQKQDQNQRKRHQNAPRSILRSGHFALSDTGPRRSPSPCGPATARRKRLGPPVVVSRPRESSFVVVIAPRDSHHGTGGGIAGVAGAGGVGLLVR
mmetsp:Transcript_15205/g.31881  ORF Transcript_15205/g.31881 Transcript_15205/m.31881 type:complete len:284 (-) Transcript_15205:140-991(-)